MNNLTTIQCPHCKTLTLYDFSIMKGIPSAYMIQPCIDCNKNFNPEKNIVKED